MSRKIKTIWMIATLLTLILILSNCSNSNTPNVPAEKVREYANALYNRELYSQSIVEYQRYLDLYPVDDNIRANIHYTMGNIYFERIHDYQNALAQYLKVRHLFPESALNQQVSKQIVACLERLGQSADAKQALDEAASLNPDKAESRPGQVIAKIGNREITTGDLDFQISQLPEYMQSQFSSRETKLEFLKQYIATELFYDAAKRKGLDQDKDVIEGAFQAKKQLMVQKHIQDEIIGQINVDEDDVRLYYEAHKENYTEKDDDGKVIRQKPLSEVQQQAAQDYVREKQQQAYQKLLEQNLSAENVSIYDDLIQ